MSKTINRTDFNFEGIKNIYRGKVREVYTLENDVLVMVATDRLSCFDVVLPKQIPFKGQILNQIACVMLGKTAEIVPNWLINSPDENVSIGESCEPFKVEMVIRGYLAGHAAREYKLGKRILCGVSLPDGLKENDILPKPIITPTTKADLGSHDEDISRENILKDNIVSKQDYEQLEEYTHLLFEQGSQWADSRGLILVDTKYEFGKTKDGKIVVIDEIHTPDSSRYFYKKDYKENQDKGIKQKQLSKEFVRQWLIENGFEGKQGQVIPELTDDKIKEISDRYIELYETIIGESFVPADTSDIDNRIEKNVKSFFADKI
ncbi:MAG: phosphoribosylaminoimidazolesuccinocarboxamide synthase [Flavobacteriaceae bacterium]|nr:phosphoribosylaminoimidazolesuccinocarboxamide synthase [Flavobacteriaceae bacterium]